MYSVAFKNLFCFRRSSILLVVCPDFNGFNNQFFMISSFAVMSRQHFVVSHKIPKFSLKVSLLFCLCSKTSQERFCWTFELLRHLLTLVYDAYC